MFCVGLVKNRRIIENSLRPGGSGEDPQRLRMFVIFANFPLVTLIFPKISGSVSPPNQLIIHYLEYKGVRGRSPPPEHQRKFKIFTEK